MASYRGFSGGRGGFNSFRGGGRGGGGGSRGISGGGGSYLQQSAFIPLNQGWRGGGDYLHRSTGGNLVHVDYGGFNKITSTVYLGGVTAVTTSQGRRMLQQLKIKHVLTASQRPVRDHVPPGVRYKFINVFDMRRVDLLGSGVLHEALNYIDAADAKQEPILVHCEAGVSRSVTLVCAHLMKKFNRTVEETIDFIKERRPQADPNDSFRVQLKIFEKAGYSADPSSIRQSSAYAEFLPQLKHFGIEPRLQVAEGMEAKPATTNPYDTLETIFDRASGVRKRSEEEKLSAEAGTGSDEQNGREKEGNAADDRIDEELTAYVKRALSIG